MDGIALSGRHTHQWRPLAGRGPVSDGRQNWPASMFVRCGCGRLQRKAGENPWSGVSKTWALRRDLECLVAEASPPPL